MIDIGTGMAICGGCFSAVAIFYRIVPRKERDCNAANHCQDHSGIVKGVANIEGWMKSIDDKITIILRNGRGQ